MYEPHNSNYHDHLCNCPGCMPPDPDPTDSEVARMRADYLADLAASYRDGRLELADLGEMHCDGHITDDELDALVYGPEPERPCSWCHPTKGSQGGVSNGMCQRHSEEQRAKLKAERKKRAA